jgi:pimeloyl-ACP methyl ester carboxylesterase
MNNTVGNWFFRIVGSVLLLLLLTIAITSYIFYTKKKALIAQIGSTSAIAETQSGSMEYLVQGDADKYILFLHGTPGSYRTFNTQVLLDKGYSIISPSRPGYFRTPLTTGKTLNEQVDALANLLNELDIDSVDVIAFSGSGPMAIQLALTHTDRIKHLALLAPVFQSMPPPPPPENLIEKIFASEIGTWISINFFVSPFKDPNLKAQASEYAAAVLLPFNQVAAGKQNDAEIFENVPQFAFEALKVPTLITFGTNDFLYDEQALDEMINRLPDVKYIRKEGKKHFDIVFYDFEQSLLEAVEFFQRP